MSDCDHKCTECDRKPCIEFSPKMAVPRELQTDYGIMVTAHILMAVSIDSLGRKNEQLQAENAKLRELAKEACELARIFYDCGGTFNDLDDLLCEASELGIEVDG